MIFLRTELHIFISERKMIVSAIKTLIAIMDQHEEEKGEGVLLEHTRTMNRFYIGDICWVISDDEYQDYVLPVCTEQFYNSGYLYSGEKRIDFLTGDASASGWPQDSGVLGVLRFDDLEPEYQERAEGGVQLRVEGSLQDRFRKHELRAH